MIDMLQYSTTYYHVKKYRFWPYKGTVSQCCNNWINYEIWACSPHLSKLLDKSLIYGVHLCDGLRPEEGAPWPDERELRGCLPGEGDLPVAEWMDAVKSTGFDGFVSGEFLNPLLWERDLLEVAREMRMKIEEYL